MKKEFDKRKKELVNQEMLLDKKITQQRNFIIRKFKKETYGGGMLIKSLAIYRDQSLMNFGGNLVFCINPITLR